MRFSGFGCVVALLVASYSIGCSHNLLKKAQRYELAGNNSAALIAYQEALAKTPESNSRTRSEILLQMAECFYRLDRLSDAFTNFEKAVEADPKNPRAHLRLGEMLLAAGSPDRAREQAMLALNSMAKDNEALSLLGAAWVASDNPAMAKTVYEQVLQSDPKRVTVAVALADIYNRESNVDKARRILKQASEAQPGSALPSLATARLEEQEGNSAEAEEAYRRAVAAEDTPETNMRLAQFLQRAARITEAEQVLRRVDSHRRNQPIALADFQLLSGRSGEALEQYRIALDQTNRPETKKHFWRQPTPSEGAMGSQERATVAARLIEAEIANAYQHYGKQRSTSLASIREQLDRYRSSLDQATISILETELALADNNLVAAQASAKSATDVAPDSAGAHYVAGQVQAFAGNDKDAETEWETALENDPHYTPAHLALAEAAIGRGDSAKADEHSRAAVRDDPGNFHAVVLFARALLLQDKPRLAAIMANRAAALDPSSTEPTLLLGEIALKLNNLAQALLAFERTVAMHPSSEEAMDGLLRVYRRGPVSYAALQKMEKVAVKPPVSSTLLEITGRLYADHGWYSEAIRSLTAAVAADPSRATASRMLARLQLATGDFAQASKATAEFARSQQPLLDAYEADSKGNWEKAISEYERAVHEGDQTGVAANNLAWLYAQHSSQLDRALSLAESAVKLSPNDPLVLDTLGFVHLQRREYSSAVEVLETAARLNAMSNSAVARGASEQIRKHLSDAYLRSGQTAAATQISQNRGAVIGKYRANER